jgi:hypothetical protein
VIEDGLPWRKIGWQVAPRAEGRAARRRSRRRWSAESGLAVCHVWMREADSVGDSSTLHQKGCLDTWYHSSSLSHEVSSLLSGK